MGMNWIDWAFEQELPTAEKLVLVHLAADVNHAGVGLWDRDRLEARCGYKKRSIQRLLKVLRERGHLSDHSAWYRLVGGVTLGDYAGAVIDDLKHIPTEALAHGGRPMTLRQVADAEDGGRPEIDGEAVGEAVARHVIDAGEYLIDNLQAFEARLASQITRLVTLHVEREPPPPPDPVKENPLYRELLDAGIDEAKAYRLSKADLEMDIVFDESSRLEAGERPRQIRSVRPTVTEEGGVTVYEDSARGRFQRILAALYGPTWGDQDTAAMFARWQALEEQENKHTVAGEVAAFELLYPAIVEAARRLTGRASIEQFVNLDAAAKGLAPWDMDPAPTPQDDAVLEREIGQMLVELEAFNDPRCTVGPRTTEKAEDGSTLTETMLGYHRRVSAKLREARKMKQMGMLG